MDDAAILDCDDEWDNFCNDEPSILVEDEQIQLQTSEFPKCSKLYISTQTKISYLNKPINLAEVFWKIKVNPYSLPESGVIKKQMKFNFTNEEQIKLYRKKVDVEKYYDEYIIKQIRNPEGKVKFKDVRKISIGLAKKDILSYRRKKKGAFYNCFVLILRLWDDVSSTYKESHVKVFNTGKLELPGIQCNIFLKKILNTLVMILNKNCGLDIKCLNDKTETVLINSNFNCGFYINREKLYDILKFNYRFQTSYDPCSYPGIMSKFYYNHLLDEQTGIKPTHTAEQTGKINEVSFMVFRTGSVLIVGKCEEDTLMEIYNNINVIITNEYLNINQKSANGIESKKSVPKKKKVRRKEIIIIEE